MNTNKLLGFFIKFYPTLAKVCGDIKSAILLQQLMYWWPKKKGNTVYKTVDELQKETTLSRWQQETILKKLQGRGFLSYENKGIPPKRHFTVYPEKIELEVKKYNERHIYNSKCSEFTQCNGEELLHITEITTKITTENTKIYRASDESDAPSVLSILFAITSLEELESNLSNIGSKKQSYKQKLCSIFGYKKSFNEIIDLRNKLIDLNQKYGDDTIPLDKKNMNLLHILLRENDFETIIEDCGNGLGYSYGNSKDGTIY